MTMRKVVTGLLVISLGICTLPAAAETSADTFKASVDRAIASTAKEATKEAGASTAVRQATGLRAAKGPVAFASGPEAGQAGSSGGGGGISKVSLIMTIVGTAAGAAGTYYMVKQLKKIQTNTPNANGQ
jgi:hypothetical protein